MAEGSDSAKSKGKTGLLARRLQQKERIYGQREKRRGHTNEHKKEKPIDYDDAVACVAAHTGCKPEDLSSPGTENLSQIYIKFAHIVNDLEVVRSRLIKTGDKRSMSRLDEQAEHCVRCHKEYLLWQDGPKACVIEHDERIEPEEGQRDYRGQRQEWYFPCNGERIWAADDDGPGHYCFEGPHTRDPAKVTYTDPKSKKNTKNANDDDSDFEILTFPTCRQAGCEKSGSQAQPTKKRQRTR